MQLPMGGRLLRVVMAAALALAALVGCSPDREPASPTATIGTAPPVTPTTDPYAVPAVVDAAYVNRVLAGLDAAMGEVVRMVVRTRGIPQEAADRLQALYLAESRIQLALDSFQDDIRNGFRTYRPEPGNKRTSVTEMISASQACIFVKVLRDFSQVGNGTGDMTSVTWVGLKPRDPTRDRWGYNPTPWAILVDGFQEDRSQPRNPCVA